MEHSVEIIIFSIIGAILLWFGYTMFFRKDRNARKRGYQKSLLDEFETDIITDKIEEDTMGDFKPAKTMEDKPGETKICPVCSSRLNSDELVSSSAFPPREGASDRLMHIRGCLYCLRGDRDRICPVCKKVLIGDDVLICRLFERARRRIHVHVLGCSQCRGRG